MGVYLQGENFATQGPVPDGFHVPLQIELEQFCNQIVGLGFSAQQASEYIKLPLAGYFPSYYGGNPNTEKREQGSATFLWSSTKRSVGVNQAAYMLIRTPSQIVVDTLFSKSNGASIRPFKNVSVQPDSSWYVLYQGSGSAGVYYNVSLGIISISSDGSTWTTIADKNLGATQVYNYGDTMSETNCGKLYQRGNNYGFEFSGPTNKSADGATVDASNYGPGNYYNNSTFIVNINSWDSSGNGNLRGGVDGNVPAMSELKNAYIGEYVPNFATQGPCPDGFHVPLDTEWQAVYNTGWCRYLKLPFAGRREYDSGGVAAKGSQCFYWASSSYSDVRWAYLLKNEGGYAITRNRKTFGFSIRPFKDVSVQPDSSWTVLYQGSGNAGVYHNSSLGLISLSTDGTTRITIADKNLGATQVWNNGDTLSEANCGKYYQRGNNYGFAWTGSVTTSSTRVDASTYGPGNYYSSSTFITYDGAWDSTGNKNLRGGVDGNVPV